MFKYHTTKYIIALSLATGIFSGLPVFALVTGDVLNTQNITQAQTDCADPSNIVEGFLSSDHSVYVLELSCNGNAFTWAEAFDPNPVGTTLDIYEIDSNNPCAPNIYDDCSGVAINFSQITLVDTLATNNNLIGDTSSLIASTSAVSSDVFTGLLPLAVIVIGISLGIFFTEWTIRKLSKKHG